MRLLSLVIAILLMQGVAAQSQPKKEWQAVFAVDKKNLGIKGSNSYFNLTPGYQLSYKEKNNTDVVTVLAETLVIDGVTTRVLEDRETSNGKLVELTHDY